MREVAKYFEVVAEECDLMVSATRAGLLGLRELTTIPEEKLAWGRMPVVPLDHGPAEPRGRVRFLFVGREAERKGLFDVLAVAEDLIGKGLPMSLDVVSSFTRPSTDQIRFHGLLPHHEVLNLLRASSVFIQMSRAETYYIPVLEAMQHGVPVVVSDIEPINEIVGDGSEGFLVPPGSTRRLAEVVAAVVSDPDLRTSMGRACKMRIAEEFSKEVVLTDWLDLYRRAISQKDRRSP